MKMWDELKAVRIWEACNFCCVFGDFNSIRNDGERRG